MIITILLSIIALLLISNVFLWKYGFVQDAENPKPVLDRPIMDEKERKAILKRLKRWREEGKISREDFERFDKLCRSEWDSLS